MRYTNPRLLTLLQPMQIIADFEEAPSAAVRAVYGDNVVVSGCWFHYAQALIKRMRKLGLSDQERRRHEVYRCLLSLPTDDIIQAFAVIDLHDQGLI